MTDLCGVLEVWQSQYDDWLTCSWPTGIGCVHLKRVWMSIRKRHFDDVHYADQKGILKTNPNHLLFYCVVLPLFAY
jgi:hypothetical protein